MYNNTRDLYVVKNENKRTIKNLRILKRSHSLDPVSEFSHFSIFLSAFIFIFLFDVITRVSELFCIVHLSCTYLVKACIIYFSTVYQFQFALMVHDFRHCAASCIASEPIYKNMPI